MAQGAGSCSDDVAVVPGGVLMAEVQGAVQDHKADSSVKRLTTWEILNSQLVLWFLGSIVLACITGYWNHRNDARAETAKHDQRSLDRQREDSQFLGNMLPYLTGADPNVRLRAVDVILSRYPVGEVPDSVYRLTAKVIGTEAAVGQSQQTAETRSLVATVARTLDRQASPAADVSAVQQLPPRIYLQIFEEEDRAGAQKMQDLLRKEGRLVPGIENVSSKIKPVKGTFVRYFNDSDAATAGRIRETLMRNGFPQAIIQKSPLKANPGNIEVWFGEGSGSASR